MNHFPYFRIFGKISTRMILDWRIFTYLKYFRLSSQQFRVWNFFLILSTFSLKFSPSNSEFVRYSPFAASILVVPSIILPIFESFKKINSYYEVRTKSLLELNSIQKAFALNVYIFTTKHMLNRWK